MNEILLLLQSAVIVLMAFAATRLMRGRSAAERHTVWVAAFAVLLLLPVGHWLPESTRLSPAVLAMVSVASASGTADSAAARNWLSDAWMLGVILCLLRVLGGMARGFVLVYSARKTGDHRIRYSSVLTGPVAWGIGRKLMLLPAAAVEWDADRRALVLSHEAAHLRRNDCWALLAAESACALFWLNPLVWIAASELRREQEHAADDEVLNAGADPTTYAGHLVALARAGRPPILAAGAISRSQLTGRVEAILDPRRVRRMPTRTMILATVLALFAVAAPLVSMQAQRKVEKIGQGGVSAPRLIQKEEPKYTEEAREAKIQGSVKMSVIVEADGRIYDAEIINGLDPGLDANAIAAVRTWVFEPATKQGQPVAVSANIEVNFRLL